MIKNYKICPAKVIPVDGGDVMHFMKSSSFGFNSFGEVYFSNLYPGVFKGWKKHTRFTASFVVPVGGVNFFIQNEPETNNFSKITLNEDVNYDRLLVPAEHWYGFTSAVDKKSLIACFLDQEHEQGESMTCGENDFFYDWRKL